ncbi:MAG: hypothetical protein ABIA21_00115 [Candidatus Aenigmatarchaeota archaeon]
MDSRLSDSRRYCDKCWDVRQRDGKFNTNCYVIIVSRSLPDGLRSRCGSYPDGCIEVRNYLFSSEQESVAL